jgi:hypothetical protein
MKRAALLLLLSTVALVAISKAQNTEKPGKTRAFTKGVFVKDGAIIVKGGYIIVLSKNNKTATISSKGHVAFVFTCDSDSSTNDDCLIIQDGRNSMRCFGTNCKLTTIIGGVKYEVDFLEKCLRECL